MNKVKAAFDRDVDSFSEFIDANEPRVKQILLFLGDLNDKNVLDAGCGKGRFMRVLKNKFKKINLYGIDISEKMLKFSPEGSRAVCASMSGIVYRDDYFDCIYCVEALGHALIIEEAIREMARALKPGGKIIIIDKNKDIDEFVKMKLKPEPWERWFRPKEIIGLLQRYNIKATYKFIQYDSRSLLHNLFIAWQGVKPLR